MTRTAKAVRAPFSYYVERAARPSVTGIRKVLGRACAPWDDLESMLRETFGLKAKIHYMYGERYGWALRFERHGRLAAAMYPNRGHLRVQIILNPEQVHAALAMSLPPHVAAALKGAKDYPEGRWLFIPVRSRKEAREVQPIVALKFPLPGVAGKHSEGGSHVSGRALNET
jgi:hypothetical protein